MFGGCLDIINTRINRQTLKMAGINMKSKKSCILLTAFSVGALIALVSASMAMCMFEDKADICYMLKRKAKKAVKQMENKIDEKLDC